MNKTGAKEPGDDITIARFEHGDLDEIMRIELDSFTAPWSRQSYEELEPLESIDFFVAKKNGTVAGYILLQHIYEEMELHTLAVAKDLRYQGIARKLLNYMIEEARKMGVISIFLQVRPSNSAARPLYESLGFKPIGLRPNYYRDDGEAAIVMKLEISRE